MTLKEFTDLVCTKVHRTDEETRAEVKEYVRARYKMIWESRAWRDALNLLTLPVEQVQRVTVLPGVIDRVQGIRWGDNTTLQPESLGSIMRIDPARFDQMGDPANFSIIAPSAVELSPAGGKVHVQSSDANASYRVSIRGMIGNAERGETITVAGTALIESRWNYDEIGSLSKDSTDADLTVSKGDGGTILFLDASESGRQFQRIHFFSQPAESKPLLILFKRRFRPLIDDSDATELSGIDNALLAAAISDVLEGQRQYAKAAQKASEAGGLTQQMADLEQHQSASASRFIPEPYGDSEEWRCG